MNNKRNLFFMGLALCFGIVSIEASQQNAKDFKRALRAADKEKVVALYPKAKKYYSNRRKGKAEFRKLIKECKRVFPVRIEPVQEEVAQEEVAQEEVAQEEAVLLPWDFEERLEDDSEEAVLLPWDFPEKSEDDSEEAVLLPWDFPEKSEDYSAEDAQVIKNLDQVNEQENIEYWFNIYTPEGIPVLTSSRLYDEAFGEGSFKRNFLK